jgi:leucyl aminopeptidase
MQYDYVTKSTNTLNYNNIYGIFSDNIKHELSQKFNLDDKSITKIDNIIKNELDSIWYVSNTNDADIFIINCGLKHDYNEVKHGKVLDIICDFIFKKKINQAILSLPLINKLDKDTYIEKTILHIENARYQFLECKSKISNQYTLKSILLDIQGASPNAITNAQAIANGLKLTKDLANLPANICTPEYIAKCAKDLELLYKNISVKILCVEEMKKLGMGALLAVGQGSINQPRLIEIKYSNNAAAAPIVFVGKGITFDSGGISLKPSASMEEMRFDMCGAASVLGTIKACAELNLPTNVIGILACAENMPSGSAVKPGDVVTSLSGLTIEITNTDAEGRLVLADALTYAEQFKPKFVIDVATLTGAVIIALGNDISGFMANDDNLSEIIIKASQKSSDKVWRLPLDESFKPLLESPTADLNNSPAKKVAGSIIGGTFLANFTNKYHWAHIDIAGTAWVGGSASHATGRPLPLLIQILRDSSNAS